MIQFIGQHARNQKSRGNHQEALVKACFDFCLCKTDAAHQKQRGNQKKGNIERIPDDAQTDRFIRENPVFEMFPYKVRVDAAGQEVYLNRKKISSVRPSSMRSSIISP